MASLNKILLIGNLGADPETRYSGDGKAITNIRIATTDTWKDKATGEKKEATEWHRVVFFGRLAEIAGEHLRKGSACYVEGRLRTRKWTDKDGKDQYTTEITADQMQLLGGRGDSAGSAPAQARATAPRQAQAKATAGGTGNGFDDMDDDIPF